MINGDVVGKIVLALAIVASAALVRSGMVHFRGPNTVSVKGLSEKLVESDQAVVNFTASVASSNLEQINSEVLKIQKGVTDFLKQNGFTDTEIRLSPPSITDRWSNEYMERKAEVRYIAKPNIMLDTKNISQVSTAVQKSGELISQGITLSSVSISYYFNGLNEIKPEMVREATEKARESAQSFAELSQAKIGKIKSASQGTFAISSPTNDYDANSSVMKKVRVVTDVEYFLE